MSYVKNTWTNGDTVTAAKLNNMENGIAAVDTAQAAAFAPDITTPSNGDVIEYDSTAEKWVNGAVFAPDITNPQDGDTLVYNATQQKWVNGAGGGGAEMVIPSFTATMSPQSITCDKTYAEVYTAASQGLVPYALLTVTGIGSMTLQFDGISDTQYLIFKYSQFGTITGIIDTRQYYEILLVIGEHSRNLNISTVESQSPIIIDNDPEPEPDPGPAN